MSSNETGPVGAAALTRVQAAAPARAGRSGRAVEFDAAVTTQLSAAAAAERADARALERRLERRQDAERRGFRVIESEQRTLTVEATERVTVQVVEDDDEEVDGDAVRDVALQLRSSGTVAPPSGVDSSGASARAIERYAQALGKAHPAPTVAIYASSRADAVAFGEPDIYARGGPMR